MTPAAAIQLPEVPRLSPLFGSPFRTHSKLPYFIFSPKERTAPAPAQDITLHYRSQDATASFGNTLSSVETSIWSGTVDPDDDLDPLAPRVGTRAYRERERRLHEQETASGVMIPNTVTVDLEASRAAVKEGVRVESKLEMIEEVTPRASISS